MLLACLVLSGCVDDLELDCEDPAAAGWQAERQELEEALWQATNGARAAGADCASGPFVATEAVALDPALTCAARGHALNMATNDFFDHESLDGSSPGDRIEAAGYTWSRWSENIAAGQAEAEDTVDGWLDSTTGHCENLLDPEVVDGGFGYAYDASSTWGHYWVQLFGRP